uniref:endopeptidase La n=1 Tax=Arcella intermedia TaxID=1963864 RepID=A0A6B2KZ80_9EUKA
MTMEQQQEIESQLTHFMNLFAGFSLNLESIRDKLASTRPSLNFSQFLDACTEFLSNPAAVKDISSETNLLKKSQLLLQLLKEHQDMITGISEQIQQNLGEPVLEKDFVQQEINHVQKMLQKDEQSYQVASKYISLFQSRLGNCKLPEQVATTINEEIEKLKELETYHSEFGLMCDYLDFVSSLPWDNYTKDNFDIHRASDILDQGHYGLKDVKERIKEFIATGAMTGTVKGKILCFTGPPGTGKTSIAKSIANTLDRQFHRISVGGTVDPSEIKGHRRTYIGSRAGKIINGMKQTKSSNPVLLIDEIDKIGRDPANCLLEALDPSQNTNFMDNYLDLPFNLSDVLFICTSNDHTKILPPLLDRMEVIEISGYVSQEKMEIAIQCLIPNEIEKIGLQKDVVTIGNDALNQVILQYCIDPGIRTLKKFIQRIFSKACLQIARGLKTRIHVDKENLQEYIDVSPPPRRRYYDSLPIGVSLSIHASYGSLLQYVETTVALGNKDKIKTTGSMGDVITESTNIAYTYAQNYLAKIDPQSNFFEKNSIHIHFPTGSIPKDSAACGAAIVTSLLSLALGTPAQDIAIIGEITLSGLILEAHGIKEKAIAAQTVGINEVILPVNNQAEWEQLEDIVKKDIKVHYVQNYHQVYPILFPQLHHPSNILN